MAEEGTRLCEVCTQPIPPDQPTLKVGSCEFPFDVHPECRDQMSEVAGFVEELCVLSDEQPEGMVQLGSWGDEPNGDQAEGGEISAEEAGWIGVDLGEGGWVGTGVGASGGHDDAAAFLDAYLDKRALPEDGPLNVENATVYLHGWWPAAIRLNERAYQVRDEPDPEGLDLPQLVTEHLGSRGLRACQVDERLLESIALQRVGLLGGAWKVWAADDDAAAQAVAEAAAG